MNKNPDQPVSDGKLLDDLIWWAMLVIAVLAIPSLAIIVVIGLPLGELGQTIGFILACWACVWIGMWLMRKAANKKAGQ